MKKKNIVFLVLFLIVVVISSYFYAFVKKDKVLYDNATYKRSMLISGTQINENSDFNYSFHCENACLKEIKIMLSYTGKKTGSITYTLYDENGNAVTEEKTKKLSSFKNGKYTTLGFDEIKDSKNHDYTLRLKSENSSDNSAVVLVEPSENATPGICYTYVVWNLETMIVFILCLLFLMAFARLLVKIFRK